MIEKDNILSKWLQGEVSDAEVKAAFPEIDLSNLKRSLSMQENFEITATDPETQWEAFEAKLSEERKSPKKRTLRNIIILVLGLLIAFGLYYMFSSPKTTIKADKNEFINYALEDGSTIKLWPGSSFSFNESDYLRERIIDLKGEAFFNVEKGNRFQVRTEAGKVEVLGTSFNVWTADVSNLEVACHTGRVRVSDNHGRSTELNPGLKVKVTEDKLQEVTTFDLERQNNARLKYYDSAEARWVLSDLENLFGVQFDIDSSLLSKRFNGAISIVGLDEALTYLCETLNWQYEIEGETISIKSNN